MIRKYAVVTLLASAVTGCQTDAKPGLRMDQSEMQELANEIAQRCLATGAKKDTPAMTACIGQETRKEVAARAR